MSLAPGRIVHYVLLDRNGITRHRPAVVVQVWSETCANLQVFTDGTNDGQYYSGGVYWATSVSYSDSPRPYTWHWPERDEDVPVADLVAA